MQYLLKGVAPISFLAICLGVAYVMMATKPEPFRRPPAGETMTVRAKRMSSQDFQVVIPSQGIIQARTQSTLIPRVNGEVIWISDSFRSGGFFKQDEPLVRIDPSDYETALSTAEARLLAAEASLELASLTHQRNQEVIKENLIPRAELDLSAANLKVAQSDVQSAQAALGRARRDLERTTIKAPFDGRVLTKSVDIGQGVAPGNQLAEIFATDYAEIRLPLRNDQLDYITLPEAGKLNTGSKSTMLPEVRITGKYGTQDANWIGQVVRTQSAYDARSRELFVIAQIDAPFERESDEDLPLKLNQYVGAEIQGHRLEEVYVIPRSALRNHDEVIIIGADGTISRRSVKVIWKQGEDIVINEGIADNELLCLTPMLFAADGTTVIPWVEGEAPPTALDDPQVKQQGKPDGAADKKGSHQNKGKDS